MPLYLVRVWTAVYVEADSEMHAQDVVDKELHHIASTDQEWEVEPEYEVTAERGVRHGWSVDSYPYSDSPVPLRTIRQVLEEP